MAEPTPAGPGMRIALHFALKLANGDLVDRTPVGRAALFDWGDGRLPPPFEALLEGMSAGASDRFEVKAEQGFGPRRPENVQTRRRDEFDPAIKLEQGLVIQFQDPRGDSLPGVVRAFDDAEVEIDFNHPLAGQDLVFEVEIVQVTPTPED